MDDVLAVAVGLEQRADQHHRGAGGADEAGQERAEGENAGIDPRRGLQVAPKLKPAGDHVQAEEQHDERDVFAEDGVLEHLEDRRQARFGGVAVGGPKPRVP